MAGQKAPDYLVWSCRSIGAASDLFDMIIFHENNRLISQMPCAENVRKINLQSHGLAAAVAAGVVKGTSHNQASRKNEIHELLKKVFSKLPYFLAEFKIGTGLIFEEYLTEYSHWTYTDPDILWGRLSDVFRESDMAAFDLITMGKSNDASRLFLRGQFTLHRNGPELNSLWRSLTYMSPGNVARRMGGVVTELKAVETLPPPAKAQEILNIKRKYFISAEGAYSSLVFKNRKHNVLITGRMLSDKNTRPVMWKAGTLVRCSCSHTHKCLSHTPTSCASQRSMSHSLPPMSLKELTVGISNDCGMNWLAPEHRLCGMRPKLDEILNEAVYVNGSWHYNDESVSLRYKNPSGAMFHFRVWEDVLSNRITSALSSISDDCFMAYLSLEDRIMYFHPCNTTSVRDIPIYTYREYKVAQYVKWKQQTESKHLVV
eukprot:CAMPEP_0185030194 /NCGR_PEP_ID=MMETSP1103-20130426/16997_1 /TAXON_ID=36769 /ORGANISM="Paraphysomonas bandaiensis, Strain Caron Lab Isolate" /LENGTH=429 /DNA_ID=CAMNT_0027565209 /DNA_START=213 /DNA_END=1502 /DNA_ORIENTATION=+